MSNHKIKQALPPTNRGFTLIEMLIIAPIVILVIGIFVSSIISMTGEVLSDRGENAMSYNIQDALNRIEQDVKSSNEYLATNSITLSDGQGYNDGTGVFQNVGANGTMLILSTSATDKGPTSATRNIINRTSTGQPIEMNVVYFTKTVNGVSSLWRRVIAPSDYLTAGASVPWQKPTCQPEYVAAPFPFCKTKDTKLVDGIIENGFSIKYHTAAAPLVEIADAVNSGLSDVVRQSALATAESIGVNISVLKTIAGREVSQSGSTRVGKVYNSTDGTISLSGSNGGTWAYKRPIVVTNSTGAALTNYQIQVNPFTDAAFINNAGLVGSWHFNEGAGISAADFSGNNNNGAMNGTSYWNTGGKFGGAFIGNGSSNYVDLGSSIKPTAFTYGAWIKLSGSQSSKTIMGVHNDATGGSSLGIDDGTPNVLKFHLNSYSQRLNSAVSLNDNNWHFVVATYSNPNAALYVDGVLVASASNWTTPPTYPALNYNIGRWVGGGSQYFNGYIDEPLIYNRALSAAEIALRYGTAGVPKVRGDYADVRFTNSTKTVEYPYWQETDGKYWVKIPSLPSGDSTINMYYGNPIAINASSWSNTFAAVGTFASEIKPTANTKLLWHMNNNWTDSSGNAFTGTASGATFSSLGKLGTYAGSFNGTSNYAYKSNNALLNSTTGSIEMWIKPTALPSSYGTIVSKWVDSTYGYGYRLLVLSTGNVSLTLGNGTATSSGASTANGIVSAGNWYHIVASWTAGGGRSIYVNGALAGSGSAAYNPVYLTGNLNLGKNVNEWFFNGLIDEFRFENSVLSSSTIMADSGVRQSTTTEPNHTAPGAEVAG